jgi:two-component system sensor histidine kinase/response regulator
MAGMDDHIAKPLELSKLHALPRSEATCAARDRVPVLDTGVLSEACGGDPIQQRELLLRCRRYLGADLRLLADAIGIADAAEAWRLAHRVKGAAGTIGAHALARAAERIERIAADAPPAEWHARHLELQSERRRIEERLDALVGSVDSERPGSAS